MTPFVVAMGIVSIALAWALRRLATGHDVSRPVYLGCALLFPAMVFTDTLRFTDIAHVPPLVVLVAAEACILGLVLTAAALFRSWGELLCETWLTSGGATLASLFVVLLVRAVPETFATDVDIILVSLALLLAVTLHRAGSVLLTNPASRTAMKAFVWVRYAAWICMASVTAGPVPEGATLGKIVLTVAYGFALAVLWHENREPSHPDPDRRPAPRVVLPFALSGVLVAILALSWFFVPAMSRWSVAVLGVGSATALLYRQVLTHARLVATIDDAQARERYYHSLVQDSTDVIAICDERGRLAFVSSAAQRVLGAADPHGLVGASVAELLHVEQDVVAGALAESARTGPTLLEGSNGERLLEASIAQRGEEYVLSVRDVTERAAMRRQLHALAFRDELTGLANRRRLLDDVAALLARAGTGSGSAAADREDVHALFVDLDGFKQINDAKGHSTGDVVLAQVAGRLREVVDPTALLARLGGDEFVVVVRGPAADAEATATVIHRALSRPFAVDAQVYQIGASIGIARHEPGVDAEELLQRADLAMYAAKLAHRPWRRYEPAMSAAVRAQADRDQELAQEWGRGAVGMYLQPIVSTATLEVHSAEALLRWRHPGGKVDGPMAALSFAARTGRLATLTGWMVEQVLAEITAHPEVTTPIAVNMPPSVLAEPDFVAGLAARVAALGIPPTRVNLEITEDALVEQGHAGLRALRALHDEGFHLHIDDFGTGFSSLSYLVRLPVRGLKIDRSFTRELPHSMAARSVVLGLVSLSRELSVDLVAEGVETEAEHEQLVRLGVPLAQGYWYARPADVASITDRTSLAGWPGGLDPAAVSEQVPVSPLASGSAIASLRSAPAMASASPAVPQPAASGIIEG